MNTKIQQRKRIKDHFSEQNRGELDQKDDIIFKKILTYIETNNVQNICIYENVADEVDTDSLIKHLQEKGKSIYTPQMISETEMILIDSEYEVYEKEIDLFIIPARAYTISGKRLGRGRGYYDRFLSQKLYKKSKKVGICYNFQILEDLKIEKHDINMDLIVTDMLG